MNRLRILSCLQILFLCVSLGSFSASAQGRPSPPPRSSENASCAPEEGSAAVIPVDSWVYPAVLRLYSMGYLHSAFVGERPWTEASVGKMLYELGQSIDEAKYYDVSTLDEARKAYVALAMELSYSTTKECLLEQERLSMQSVYSAMRAITGTPLRDSFHLGSTMVNDYGRPYANGISSYSGFSATARHGHFLARLRGEFQASPSFAGYSPAFAQYLSETVDTLSYINPATGLPYYQSTLPEGNVTAHHDFNPIEAYVSVHMMNHEFSFGRKDEWLGPAQGGAFAYSNNAENLYALHIDRQDPLEVPILSRITGPFRYEFMVGEVQGHTYMPSTPGTSVINWVNPGKPWLHLEKISLKPSRNFELSFERTAIWGGQGHEGINVRSFLRSFFSFAAGDVKKNTNQDPGARFGTFDLSYRLPGVRKWLTAYADSLVHDDVSPVDAPRRAAWRPGVYLSHLPHASRMDFRIEGATTAPPVRMTDASHTTVGYVQRGNFLYWESIVRQGYTNNGQIFGDWIGREGKGGQAWITWHTSGSEWIQALYRRQKVTADFIAGGTTLDDVGVQMVKRIKRGVEVDASFRYELWKSHVYLPEIHAVTVTSVQLTWRPRGHSGSSAQ